MRSRLARRAWSVASFAITLLVCASAAWAVGWTNVGPAEVHLNETFELAVKTSGPVYSSQMRLYVHTHSPCGGKNFGMTYDYPDGSLYMTSSLRQICTAGETPSNWGVAGGNKIAICFELNLEPTNPASTCQRYSTT
jgi:hypothetical protein